MKKILFPLILILACTLFYACKKDFSNEVFSQYSGPAEADLGVTVTTSISGFVTNENNEPVNGATVTAGSLTAATDSFGHFSIKNATLAKIAGFVKVSYTGYFTAYKTFMCGTSKSLFTRVKLMPKTNAGTININTGGTLTTTDGAVITLPENGVVVAAGSGAYSGNVHVAIHWIDPTNTDAVTLNMPGDLRGVDSTNNIQGLNSYGMLAVELTGDGGQLLQIASGKQATLSFPVPSSLLSTAPATIPLWSFNETNGLWKEEGTATKVGGNYVGNVAHFSYWNCDEPFGAGVTITTQLVDSALHPLANTNVDISSVTGGFTGCHGFTDSSGIIIGLVPANSNLQLNVETAPCYSSIFSKNFTTTTANADLGTVSPGNTQLSEYTISGTVVNCSNNPVTDGTVILVPNNSSGDISVPLINGSFTISPLSCPGTTYSIAAIDNSTMEGSNIQPLTLTPGANNIGQIQVCGSGTLGYMRYTVDGATTTLVESLDSVNVYLIDEGPTGKRLDIECGSLTPGTNSRLGMSNGFLSTGSQPYYVGLVSDVVTNYPAADGYSTADSIPINITQFGNVGDYVIGNFTTSMKRASDNTIHTVTMDFKLKRLY